MAEAEETACVISKEILCMIAEEVGPKWMVLARLLGVKENIIDNIAVDVQDVSEKAYQSMQAWIQSMQNASDRLAVLLDVLERMGRNDIVAAINRQTRATELSQRLAVDCRVRLGQIITYLAPDAIRYLISTFDMPRNQSFDWWIYQKLCEEEARLTSPANEAVRLKKYYQDVLYPWRDGSPPTSHCEIWYKLTGNLDVEVWRYLVKQLDLIKKWHPAVDDVYRFRKKLFRLGPRKLSNKECEDLWKWLREIFAKLGLYLDRVISNYDLSGGTHKQRGVADNFWFRLAAVVQYHLPCAALQLFMRKVVLVDPAEEKGECMEKLLAMLERNKGEFIGKLSQWEKDIIYPQGTVVNAADFSIVIWRKLVQHFCPHELVRQLQTVPTVRDIEEYFSEGSGPGSQVEGLYQFQNLILNIGCKEMEEKEFDMLWECLERILTVLKYDLKKISEFRSSDFGFDFPKGATKESPERGGQDETVADNYWFRLSAVVHYHLPYAALQLFKSSVYVDKPAMEEEEFIKQLKVTLSEQKEVLVGKLSNWEKDIVYPTSAAINTGDFSIGVWRKLVQHFFPGERVLKLKSVLKISDVEKYFSEGSGPSSLVEGLYQFRNFLIRMGSRKMGDEEFNVLWECLERMLTVLKYDVAKISEFRTADFDLSCPESLTKKPWEAQFGIVRASAKLVTYAGKVASSLSKEKAVSMGAHGSRAIPHLPAVGCKSVPVPLFEAQLSSEIQRSLNQWWNDKIPGKRCAEVIVDSMPAVESVYVGALGMAGVGGMVAGPAGFLIGSIVGAVAGRKFRQHILSDYLKKNMFDIPKDVALENAYNFLHVKRWESNDTINKQFQKLCLQYHTDKGGHINEWYRLQCSMSVIRFARVDFRY